MIKHFLLLIVMILLLVLITPVNVVGYGLVSTEGNVTMRIPAYNITLIPILNLSSMSSDGTTLSMEVNTSTLKLNSSSDFQLSDISYTNDKMLFTINANSGELNISTKTSTPDKVYNFKVDNQIIQTGTSDANRWIAFSYGGAWSTHIFEISFNISTPPDLNSTTGNFWIEWTWGASTNADDYDIWIDGLDTGADTTNLSYYADYPPHTWKTISVRGHNQTTGDYGSWTNKTTLIPNNLPVMTENAITPTVAYSFSTLTSTTHTATDADGDSIIYTYLWYEDDISTGITTDSLSNLVTGSSYYVQVTPGDEYGSGTPTYSNTVLIQGQNTQITSSSTTFSSTLAGTDFANNIIPNSVTLTNSGGENATMSVKFITNYSGTYGLINSTEVIDATNFMIGNTTLETLNGDGTDKVLTDMVPLNSETQLEARLRIPSGQIAAVYSGIIEITFS